MSEDYTNKPLVLIVDDDDDIREYLGALVGGDAETLLASSGEHALALARSHQPELILLDLMMPGMDGNQVCRELKRDSSTCHIPVVFITAMADKTFESAAFKLGAIDYIVKPFDSEIVTTKVRNLLVQLRSGQQMGSRLKRQQRRHYINLAIGISAAVVIFAAGGFLLLEYMGSTRESRTPASTDGKETPPPPAATATPAEAPPAETSATDRSDGKTTTKDPDSSPKASSDETPVDPTRLLKHPISAIYDWIEDANCGEIPDVDWWQNVTPASIVLYVERNHQGDWDAYLEKWRRHYIRTENTSRRGRAIKTPEGRIVQGVELDAFVAKLRKRVEIVECMGTAVKRRESAGD